jgi:hypothetical protein
VIVSFGPFFENDKSSPLLWANFFNSKSCILIMTKDGLSYNLGDFFTNSSGHTLLPGYTALFSNLAVLSGNLVSITRAT